MYVVCMRSIRGVLVVSRWCARGVGLVDLGHVSGLWRIDMTAAPRQLPTHTMNYNSILVIAVPPATQTYT